MSTMELGSSVQSRGSPSPSVAVNTCSGPSNVVNTTQGLRACLIEDLEALAQCSQQACHVVLRVGHATHHLLK